MTPAAASSPNAEPPVSSTALRALRDRARAHQLGLARAGRAAAHVDAADRALGRREHDGAARRGAFVRPVPDADAGYVRDRVVAGPGRATAWHSCSRVSRPAGRAPRQSAALARRSAARPARRPPA